MLQRSKDVVIVRSIMPNVYCNRDADARCEPSRRVPAVHDGTTIPIRGRNRPRRDNPVRWSTPLRRLRAATDAQKVFAIAMTGYGTQEDKRRTLQAGFDAHLTKPVELESLIALLDQRKAAIKAKTAI